MSLLCVYKLPDLSDEERARFADDDAAWLAGGLIPVLDDEPLTAADDPYVRDRQGKFAEHGDALRLAGKIDLAPGEELAGSAQVDTDSGAAKVAIVDRPDGSRSIRLGIGGEWFTSPENNVPWRAGPDDSAAMNVERRRTVAEYRAVEAELNELDADPDADPARKAALEARFAALEDAPQSEVYAGGYTAGLDEVSARQLRDTVADALTRGVADNKRTNDEWDAWETEQGKVQALYDEYQRFLDEAFEGKGPHDVMDDEDAEQAQVLHDQHQAAKAALDASQPNFDYTVYAEGVVQGEWADVHYRVELDDPTSGTRVILATVPHGMSYDDLGDDTAQFDVKDAGRFLRMLARATGAPPLPETVEPDDAPDSGLTPVTAAADQTDDFHLKGGHNQKDHGGDGLGPTSLTQLGHDLFADISTANEVDQVVDGIRRYKTAHPDVATADLIAAADVAAHAKHPQLNDFYKTMLADRHADIETPATAPAPAPKVPAAKKMPAPEPGNYPPVKPAQAQAMQDGMPPPWTGEQRRALRYYTANSAVANGLLRKWIDPPGKTAAERKKVEAAQRNIPHAVSAMRPAKQAFLTYRTAGPEQFGAANVKDLSRLEGYTLTERGFMSTTVRERGVGVGGKVKLEVEVPEGTPMAYIQKVTAYPNEDEVLLPPGLKYQILSVTQGRGRATVRVRVVPA